MSVINKMLPFTINYLYNSASKPISLGFYDKSFNKLDFDIGYQTSSTVRENVHIYGTDYYITLGYIAKHSNTTLGKLGGGTVTCTNDTSNSVSIDVIQTLGQNRNKQYACFGSNSAISVVDITTLKVVFSKTGLTYDSWGGYLVTCTNDMSKVFCVAQYNPGITCFDGVTGVELWHTTGSYGKAISYNDDTGDLWVAISGVMLRLNSEDGTLLESFAHNVNNSPTSLWRISTSPDGRWISLGGLDGSHRFFDTLNKEWRTLGVLQDTYPCVWLSDNIIVTSKVAQCYLYEIPDLSVDKAIRYDPVFSDSSLYNSEDNLVVGEYGRFEATVDVTLGSGETEFMVEAFFKGQMVGRTRVSSPTSPISVRVAVDAPVDVRISGLKRILRTSSTSYAVGEQIQVLDTEYIYECTTAGTTNSLVIPYPTTGSVTDGTAVFLTKHKIANTVEHTHVVPTVI